MPSAWISMHIIVTVTAANIFTITVITFNHSGHHRFQCSSAPRTTPSTTSSRAPSRPWSSWKHNSTSTSLFFPVSFIRVIFFKINLLIDRLIDWLNFTSSDLGVYVDSSGRRSRPTELMWPAAVIGICEHLPVDYDYDWNDDLDLFYANDGIEMCMNILYLECIASRMHCILNALAF